MPINPIKIIDDLDDLTYRCRNLTEDELKVIAILIADLPNFCTKSGRLNKSKIKRHFGWDERQLEAKWKMIIEKMKLEDE